MNYSTSLTNLILHVTLPSISYGFYIFNPQSKIILTTCIYLRLYVLYVLQIQSQRWSIHIHNHGGGYQFEQWFPRIYNKILFLFFLFSKLSRIFLYSLLAEYY